MKLILYLLTQMQDYPVLKRITGISEPVVTKGQEVCPDRLFLTSSCFISFDVAHCISIDCQK